ncbi:MAG: hypothetical protein COB66_08020 [Coxiella sp. (in: Bacteria)]|nr:MAG: hypothetical protein COB66_08020 [Coxiella sp. (in: g-proteobacteria)]
MDTAAPYLFYDDLRKKGDVHWDEQQRRWQVLGYKPVCDLLKDERLSSDNTDILLETTFPRKQRDRVAPLIAHLKEWLFYSDPPEHTLLRRNVSDSFSQKSIVTYTTDVERIVADVCSTLSGEVDIVAQAANQIPPRVMAVFLDLPESDADLFLRWAFQMSEFITCPIRTPHEFQPALSVLNEQQAYFKDRDDWVMTAMLIATGIETSVSLLGGALLTLLQHPAQWQQLQQTPELLDQAIDEVLRFEPPVHRAIRCVKEDFDFEGHLFKKGDIVLLYLAAANRDATIYTNPAHFDITRANNPHLSFGYGIHYCLGRLLGRLTVRVYLKYLLEHAGNLTLVDKPAVWHTGPTLRRLESLWLNIA